MTLMLFCWISRFPESLIEDARGYSNEMNAIAYGVEVKYKVITGHTKMVTQRTIEIALQLGKPDEEIQKWVNTRLSLDFDRDRHIKSSLNNLERSPLDQYLLGMTVSHSDTQGPHAFPNCATGPVPVLT